MKHLNLSDLIGENDSEPRLAVIVGENALIITENDFMHCVVKSETVDIVIYGDIQHLFDSRYVTLTRAEIIARLGDEVDLPEWGHYWGIKDRVGRNYRLLLESMRAIGLNTDSMPDFWGKS